MPRISAIFCCVATALVGLGEPARAAFVDQSYLPTTGQVYNTNPSFNGPLGQEFTPTIGSLDFVDLFLEDAGGDIGPGANFQVNIRSGSITGSILGTSLVSYVPDNLNQGIGSYANYVTTRFTFAAPVTLAPNQVDVIEIVQLGPFMTSTSNFGAGGGPYNNSTYARGRAIVSGAPQGNFDFAFREGLLNAVPEPASVVLCGIAGLLGLGVRASRRA